MKGSVIVLAVFSIVLGLAARAFAHCEIPCGIYDDEMRIRMMEEDVATIEKSMNMILEISKAEPVNYNQLVRWVDNKERHAIALQDIAWQYFLTQRIKPADRNDRREYARYLEKLEVLHLILVHAMRAKQTTDLGEVDALRALIRDFDRLYFERGSYERRPGSIFDEIERRIR